MLNRKIALVQSSKLKYLALSSFNGGELGDSNAMAFSKQIRMKAQKIIHLG